MDVNQFKPRNQELQKYIDSFYILTHPENEKEVSYLTFPTLFSVVAAVLNAKSSVSSERITTTYSSSVSLDTSLVCRFNKPICFKYQGKIKEVCIYFKPLGLNAFLQKPLESYSSSFFDKFIPFSDYEITMQKILELDDIDSISIKIEEYWIKKRIGFEHPFLFDSIHKIQENPKIKTSELASSYNISQKTLITHFKRHLCKTPTEFKKILRFRKALTKMQSANKKTRLTELSYMIDFFDQSHMVGDFKSLTGISPKAFFKKLKCIENSNIHWIFT